MEERFLRLQAVMDRTGFKRSKIYALVAVGKFPKSLKIEGCSVWQQSEIDKWMRDRVAEAADRAA